MEFSELQMFESYSSFKTRCVKKLSKGDLTVDQLLKHLEDGETEDYLQKLNVIWDTGATAQTHILANSGTVT